MRKVHKQQLQELVQTAKVACKQLESQKGEQFVSFCGEIQNFIEHMFEYVQTVAHEEQQLLLYLETFYRAIYMVSQGNGQIKQLQGLVAQIEHEVQKSKPDKIEVVFLCYKASMSDCFESIYLAAKEDTQCDVYFVPIPYYDRNPDLSFGQMHLEGEGLYSDKYNLTDWKTYDIENRRPDVIFIMNPYDEANHVTSVHPDYYSIRLKKHTDNLVYIDYGLPYWVYRDPESVPLEEYRKSGSPVLAFLNCNYAVAYSQEVARNNKRYLSAFTDFRELLQISDQDIEERFVALGSPKFDKVVSAKKEDYTLPKEWKQIIGEKKIVLLNNSLSEFLKASGQEGEGTTCRYFDKLHAILDDFSKRDDVVLWWRPHPLLESTMIAVRRHLYPEYMSMVREFKVSGKGIFDNTEDMHRAIAWSDAMISDESSLLMLFAATGKPFYIPSIAKALVAPQCDTEADFKNPLRSRLEFMQTSKGANVGNWNCCIWWDVFLEENTGWNIHYNNFNKRFLDFVLHREKYPEAEEYRRLQLQMIQDFVVNSDGTAGQKIYEFVKEKTME